MQHNTGAMKYRAVWIPVCSCGWEGIGCRTESEALDVAMIHGETKAREAAK